MISDAIDSNTVDISEISRILFPDVKEVFSLLDNINKENNNPREFLKDLADLLEGINNIGDIDGLSNDDLEYLKQDLLDRCFSIFFKKGLTTKTLETLGASDKIIDLVEKYSKHVPYYLFYEKRLAEFFEDSPKVVEDYPKKWTSKVKTLQKNIFYKLTGGRDIIILINFTFFFLLFLLILLRDNN